MFCPQCGTENGEGSAFCANCGTALSDSSSTVVASPEETRIDTTEANVTPTFVASEGAAGAQAAPTQTPQAGNHLGPYELRGELGRGAMARVWRAWDPNLEREVAIKEPLFDQNLPHDTLEEMGRRFVAEGRAAARLNHPGIVTIHAADVYDGRPAIVMELIDGTTLSNLIERGSFTPSETLSVLDQLLDAVGYAHDAGIVHRDIKPDNIFITGDGRVKLTDFGIAHVDNASATRATMVGTVLGTPGYMSPEQATGKPVDARSDLFSVGVVGYEMLAGTNPFNPDGADSTTLLYRIVHEDASPLPDASTTGLPADLRPGIMAALQKDPAMRPPSAASMKSMLHGGAAVVSGAAPSDSLAQKARRANGLPKWLPFAALGIVLAGVLVGVFMAATSSSGGGLANTAATQDTNAQQNATTETPAENPQASASTNATTGVAGSFIVSADDGFVAIFSATRPDSPYQISNLAIDELDATSAAEVGAGIPVASVEEAQAKIEELKANTQKAKEEAQAAQKAAEEEEARKKAEEEEAARKKAEEEEAARLEAERLARTWYVCANDFVTLRTSTSTSATAIVRIGCREAVEYLGDAGGGWAHVRYNGSEGYVIAKFINPSPDAALVYDDV